MLFAAFFNLLPVAYGLVCPYPLLPVTSVSFVSSVFKGPVRQSDSTLLSFCCRSAVEPTSTRQQLIDSRPSRCDSGIRDGAPRTFAAGASTPAEPPGVSGLQYRSLTTS